MVKPFRRQDSVTLFKLYLKHYCVWYSPPCTINMERNKHTFMFILFNTEKNGKTAPFITINLHKLTTDDESLNSFRLCHSKVSL